MSTRVLVPALRPFTSPTTRPQSWCVVRLRYPVIFIVFLSCAGTVTGLRRAV